MKKRVVCLVMVALMAVSMLSGCSSSKEKLKLFLPGEYLGENTIKNFEKLYNCKVIVENFDSNESMYTKISAGDKYDVLVPSDYMIERLIREDSLQPIDREVITNFSVLSEGVKNLSFDPDNTYSIPYFWGTVGLVYNTKNVDENDIKTQGFNIYLNSKYKGKVYMYDSQRDGFMVALKALGYSCNSTNDDEINAAYEWLLKMNDAVEPGYVTDQVIDDMCNGVMDIALVYSGDATVILDENEDMAFFNPESGTNIWVDSFVIPKNAENPSLANKFINYMISDEACLDSTQTVGYTSPNENVFREMTKEGGDYEENSAYYIRSYEKDEVFHDDEYTRKLFAELWTKVKADATK